MGRHHKGRTLMSDALSMDSNWKDSRTAGVKPNSLCRVLMPNT